VAHWRKRTAHRELKRWPAVSMPGCIDKPLDFIPTVVVAVKKPSTSSSFPAVLWPFENPLCATYVAHIIDRCA
jgi:hypothetical protein